MKIGIIGLGRMGYAIAARIIDGGHQVVGYDNSREACKKAEDIGAEIADSIADLASKARFFWIMVPVGEITDAVIKELQAHCKAGDIIIDGGNSKYTDSMERAKALAMNDIIFLDCGTSGGLYGRATGFCLMVGGDHDAYLKIHSILVAIAAPGGLAHVGSSGTGHYTKMVHNGIEYGMMEAYAEGFQLIKEGAFKDEALDLEEISRIWNVSAVIRSFLLGLLHNVLKEDQELHDISGKVAQTGMGKWTVEEAERHHIRIPVIKGAVDERDWSMKTGGNYATKLVAMLRHEFGGHAVKKIKE